MPNFHPLLPVLLAGSLLISACGDQDPVSDSDVPAPADSSALDASPGSAPAAVGQAVLPGGDNLLLNPGFTTNTNNLIEAWLLTMHASNTSYTVRAVNGIATLERHENEPWGGLKQLVGREQMRLYQGQKMQVSVEAMARFNDSYGEAFQPAGLTVYLWGAPPGQSRRALLQEIVDPIDKGDTEWRTLVVEFDVPGPVAAAFVELEVFLLHTHGGEVLFRNPRMVTL
jgi:hypothetical protein